MKKKKTFFYCCVVIGITLFAGNNTICAFDGSPRRIISLGPALTEEIYLLDAQDSLVGCTVYCQRPEAAKIKEKVGTAMQVSVEKIAALQPDVVLATSLTDPKAKEKLNNLGIKVIIFSSPKNFDEICLQFLELGKIVGREKRAREIADNARKEIGFVINKVSLLKKPTVFVQLGARPLVTVTRDSFINDFIEFAGAVNIAKGQKFARYSKELVIKDNPEVIIIVTMGIRGEEEKESWQRYKTLKAARNNRIYIVDSNLLCSPTPVSFVKTLEEIVKILHPQNEQKGN